MGDRTLLQRLIETGGPEAIYSYELRHPGMVGEDEEKVLEIQQDLKLGLSGFLNTGFHYVGLCWETGDGDARDIFERLAIFRSASERLGVLKVRTLESLKSQGRSASLGTVDRMVQDGLDEFIYGLDRFHARPSEKTDAMWDALWEVVVTIMFLESLL